MFFIVVFLSPITFWFDENKTSGGSKVRLVNWLYGAILSLPSSFFVEIHPITLGTVQDLKGFLESPWLYY